MAKDNMVQAVLQFFKTGKMLKQINHTFLTLIPKSNEASSLADYRPISCCNIIYKIISKLLSNRLQSVDCLKITEDKSSKSRVYTPDTRLIIVTRTVPDERVEARVSSSLQWSLCEELSQTNHTSHKDHEKNHI